ncbi:MAG: cytochrome c-type biogenesis protein CcmH [Acidobacteriota bacterium]
MRRPEARRLLLCAALALGCGVGPSSGSDAATREAIESRLMCYCGCANLDVRTCTCGTAEAMRREIASRLERGESVEQVLAAFVSRHGEQILSSPAKEGFNLLAWIAPFGAVLAGGAALLVAVRRWGARGGAGGPPPPGTPGGGAGEALDDEGRKLLSRVEREIREGL